MSEGSRKNRDAFPGAPAADTRGFLTGWADGIWPDHSRRRIALGLAVVTVLALAVLPIALMFIGGLKVLQVTLLIVSLPILAVCVVAAVSLVKSLRADLP